MNKNLLSFFVLLPFLILGFYLGLAENAYKTAMKYFANSDNNSIEKIDLTLTKSSTETSTLENNIFTDDNKGLGYTGQNKTAIDSRGNLYFTYREKVDGKYEIFLTKIDKDNKLIFNKPITNIKSTQRVSSLTIDYRDNIHVVWYGLDPKEEGLGRQVKYTKSEDQGETWTNPINIGPVEGYKQEDYWQEHPQISSFEKNLFIVWEGKDQENTNQQIKLATSTNAGKTWSDWRNIYLTKDSTQSRPSIVIDAEGRLHLFFYSTLNEGSQQIRYMSSNDLGKTWSAPIKISTAEDHDSRHVAASYLKNKIIAVWREGPKDKDHGPSQISYSILDLDGNNWTEPQQVSKSKNYQFFPAITTNGSTAIISWMETKNDSYFPNEDPETGSLYITRLDLNKKEIKEPQLIDQNGLYPNLALDIEKDIFYLLYQSGGTPSQITLKSGKF